MVKKQDKIKSGLPAGLSTKTVKKRKVSPKGCRAKGAAFESEIVKIFDEAGIPSQKVLGSGKFAGAFSDLKVGIILNSDGTKPEADESKALFRAECKNHASTPERPFVELGGTPFAFLTSGKDSPENFFKFLEQDKISKCVFLRRSKVPTGSITNKEYNKYIGVFMGLDDFIELIHKSYGI